MRFNYTYLLLFITCIPIISSAQQADVDRVFSPVEIESLLLRNNIQLFAAKYDVDMAQAEILQAKVWPNPSLEISEVNLWANSTSEQLPRLWRDYGHTQQFALELEQLVETSNKRKKRISIKELEKVDAELAFEELLRSLKLELRTSLIELDRLQKQETQVHYAVSYFEQLSGQYSRQSENKTVSKAEYYRIQSELIQQKEQLVDLRSEKAELLSKINLFAGLPHGSISRIDSNQPIAFEQQAFLEAKENISENRVAIKRALNKQQLAERTHRLAKAEAVPDLNFMVNYDRGGNIMQDFVGLGLRIDLPVFNRNKGNIQVAQLAIQQEQKNTAYLKQEIENDIDRQIQQLSFYEQALKEYPPEAIESYQMMMDNYQKHLNNQQITLLEFIDFSTSFLEAQQTFWNLQENYSKLYQELQYSLGTDL
ncbi:TolC family protein [Sphingobacterium hungaricum]